MNKYIVTWDRNSFPITNIKARLLDDVIGYTFYNPSTVVIAKCEADAIQMAHEKSIKAEGL